MRLRARIVFALCVVVLAGCGGSLAPGATSATATPSSTATAIPTPQPTARPTPVRPVCPKSIVRFVNALQELDSRLDVGLTFAAYGDKVGDASVAYDRIPFKKLDLECTLRVGVPAERALNLYIEANNIWNDCIGNIYCSNDSITPKLQRKWAQATTKIRQARRALD